MSEAKFKKQLHRGFLEYSNYFDMPLHWQLHEDSDSVGIPDVSYGLAGKNGWLEVKWDNKMPGASSKYNPHFEQYQEAWLVARGSSAGGCHLVHGFPEGIVLMSHKGLMRRRSNMTMMDIVELPETVVLFDKFGKEAVKKILHGID